MKLKIFLLAIANAIGYYSHAQQQLTGAINGVFDVSNLGAATYTIPVEVPNGINGMKPEINISYNSQNSANGNLGIGWYVSGTSVITRGNSTILLEGKTAGATLSTDKFSLDGGRLVRTGNLNSTNNYTYATESESFVNVEGQNTGSDFQSFKVTDQSGVFSEYGISANSKQNLGSVAYAWMLSRQTDLNGNSINYEYYNVVGEEIRLKSITYGGGSTPLNRITFHYINKSAQNFVYLLGQKLDNKYKLDKITIESTGGTGNVYTLLYTYQFEYAAQEDQLLKVRHISNFTNQEMPATAFEYLPETNALGQNSVSDFSSTVTEDFVFVGGDFTGDGKSDLIQYCRKFNVCLNEAFKTYRSLGESFIELQDGNLPAPPSAIKERVDIDRNLFSQFFDYNGDGKEDYVYKSFNLDNGKEGANEYTILLSDNSGTLTPLSNPLRAYGSNANLCMPFYKSRPVIGDFDGDGKSEVIVFNERFYLPGHPYSFSNPGFANYSGISIVGEKYNSPAYDYLFVRSFDNGMGLDYNSGLPLRVAPESNGNERQEMFTIDYNGDGKNEILIVENGLAAVYEMNVSFDANKNPVFGTPMFIKVNETGYPTVWHEKYFGDFNGDGVTDILTYNDNTGWEIGYGKGNGLMNDIRNLGFSNFVKPKPFTNSAIKHRRRPILVADFNGDGKSDIFDYMSGQQSPRIFLSQGNHVFETKNLNIGAQFLGIYEQDYTTGDFNGDGKVDFLTASGISALQLFTIGAYEHAGKLKRISDGLDRFSKVDYKYLSEKNNGSYYTTTTSASYPLLNRPFPFAVVTQSAVDNGAYNSSGNITKYSYSDLTTAKWGRGLLGFQQLVSNDLAQNLIVTNTSTINTDMYILLPAISMVTKNGINISSARTVFDVRSFSGNRFGIYPKFTEKYDLVTGQNIREDFSFQETYTDPMGGTATESTYHIGKPIKKVISNGFYRHFLNVTGVSGALETITETYSYPSPFVIVIGDPMAFHRYFLPGRIQTTVVRKGQDPFSSDVRFVYNNAKGWITKKRDNYGFPHAVTTDYTYNTFGNLLTQTVSSVGCPTVVETIEYDPTNRFVKSRYNTAYPLLKSTNTYNGHTGWLSSKTDNINGITETFGYNGFGKAISVTDNTGLQKTTTTTSPQQGSPDDTRYTIAEFNNLTNQSVWKNYDRLGRLLRSIRNDFNGDVLYEDMAYNVLGQVTTSTLPYNSNGGTPVNTSFSYDNLGRQNQISAPEGNTLISYNLVNSVNSTNNLSRYTVTTTGTDGVSRAIVTDAAGRKVQATDPGGSLDFTYHSSGQVLNTVLNGSTVTRSAYNGAGREVEKYDLNYGTYQYTYDNYGKLKTQIDPKGNQYAMDYDPMGNLITKTGPEGAYNYTYNLSTAGFNLGKLTGITAPGGISESYSYGSFGRLTQEVKTIDGINFTNAFGYDGFGRLSRKYFANFIQGITLNYGYNSNDGSYERTYLNGGSIQDPKNLYTVLKKNVLGQTTFAGLQSVFYSGPITDPGQNPFYKLNRSGVFDNVGRPQYVITRATSGGDYFQDQYYSFNAENNLNTRVNSSTNDEVESFGYDNLNRLTTTNSYVGSNNFDYTSTGNISQKSDAGTFTYNSANKVSEIAPFTNIPNATQTITYTPFDKVETITEGNVTASFKYWPNGERAKMELKNNGVTYRTKYYMEDFEREISGGQTRDLVYVRGESDQYVSIVERINNANEKNYSLITDYLGSIERIVNNSNLLVVADKSYDAWGRERNAIDWSYLPTTHSSTGWDRGYTGHEHIPEFGLINMNGRLYDPVLGRMLSPDPYIMGTDNTQGYNRYTYALNNPMSYTDPNGEWVQYVVGAVIGGFSGWKIANAAGYTGWKKFGYTLAGAAVGAASGGLGAAISSSGGIAANTMGIVASSFANSLGTAVYTGGKTSVSVSFGIGSYNLNSGEFGYLGKKGNSALENIGYGLGALTNLSDLGKVGNMLYNVEEKDVINHAAIKETNGNPLISFGPDNPNSAKYTYFDGKPNGMSSAQHYGKMLGGIRGGNDYAIHGRDLPIKNVNTTMIKGYGSMLSYLSNKGLAPYSFVYSSCSTHAGLALWFSGVPNLFIHPYTLQASVWSWSQGITPAILQNSYHLTR